jgi:hypothetical protein
MLPELLGLHSHTGSKSSRLFVGLRNQTVARALTYLVTPLKVKSEFFPKKSDDSTVFNATDNLVDVSYCIQCNQYL